MERFDQQQLRRQIETIASAAGVPDEDSLLFSEALLDADLHGTYTHGITRLNVYVRRILAGGIDPQARISITSRRRSALTIDAGNGIAQVQMVKVLQQLVPIARNTGVAAATVKNSMHLGALSYLCNLAARQNMILIATSNAPAAMPPTGAREAYFGTNPFAASFPTGKGFPIKIDLATSVAARGNIIAARKTGAPIPAGWALDQSGEPTTDPEEALRGTVLPMAGHKGYALALLVEVLSAVLSGAALGAAVGNLYGDPASAQNVGHFLLLLDIAAFADPTEFLARIDAMIDEIKGLKRAGGIEEILLPGERSHRFARENALRGIPVDTATVEEIRALAGELGVPFLLHGEACQPYQPRYRQQY